jgi:small subunit ribosomal protein S6
MMRDYELMYIVRPELDDDGLRDTVKSVRAILEASGAQVVKTTLWGKRRLAYEVRRLRDGHYVLVVLRLDGAKVAPIHRALGIHDTVFRHLLVLHEGDMPEADGELEEVEIAALEPNGEEHAARPSVTEGSTVSAPAAETDGEYDELSEVPAADEEDEDES